MTSGPGQPYGKMGEVMNRHDPSTRPLARRVETDPSVWQDERSVRTVQDAPPAGASIPPYSSAPNQSTPTKWNRPQDDAVLQHVSPYPSQHNLHVDNVDDQPMYPHPQSQPQPPPPPPLASPAQSRSQSQQRGDPREPSDMPPRQEWRNSGAWGRGNNGSVGVTGGV